MTREANVDETGLRWVCGYCKSPLVSTDQWSDWTCPKGCLGARKPIECKHSWVTCHGKTYCKDCDETKKVDPLDAISCPDTIGKLRAAIQNMDPDMPVFRFQCGNIEGMYGWKRNDTWKQWVRKQKK